MIVGTLLVTSVILMTVHSAIARRKGKAFPLYIGIPVWILTMIVFFWLDSSVSVYVLCALAILIAIGSSAGNLATWSMLTDIYDIDEIRTAKRREGIYSGVTTFLRKFASGVAVLLMGFGLQAMGFDQNEYAIEKAKTSAESFNPVEYAQTSVVSGIRLMFVLIPLILLSVCLLFAIRNKINKRRFDAVLKGIDGFKTCGNMDGLSEQETADVLVATGVGKDKLWGK
uniref:Putative sodium:galactoside symporter protein n=1 Tax=uncultured bacterium contig00039 TaxID=1181527 RepID=A0A806K1P0_9BACT|nr:putative sodium:galactoside symporter protein [uncultured bacterium contig00039]